MHNIYEHIPKEWDQISQPDFLLLRLSHMSISEWKNSRQMFSTRVTWSIQSILLNFRCIYSCIAKISQLQNMRKNDNYVKKKM